MKSKDKKTLQSKTVDELVTLLREKRSELAKIRMDLVTNKVKNTHAGRAIRHQIAILETIKKEKEIQHA